MPRHKDLKRLVRGRMTKTGESYTAARQQLLKKLTPIPPNCAKTAGMSDAAVRTKTGKTWRQWVQVLDAAGAVSRPHREIARHIASNYDVPGWWAQTVTVGYEGIRGLRDKGQRRGGTYEASKSKTIAVPVTTLYRAWRDRRLRRRWLPDVDVIVRTATIDTSLRITWPDETSVHVYFTVKGSRKSQVALQHTKLPNRAAVEKTKEFWSERLTALAAFVVRAEPNAAH